MRRLTISSFLAGIAGALVLALLLFSGGQTTQAATTVTDPISVNITQITVSGANGVFTTSPASLHTVGDVVTISGSNSTPACNGGKVISAVAAGTFTVPCGFTGASTGCLAAPVCTGTASTNQVNQVAIDMDPTLAPANLPGTGTDQVQILNIFPGIPAAGKTQIQTSPSTTWAVGNTVVIQGSLSTPSIDGTWLIDAVQAANKFSIAMLTTAGGGLCTPVPGCPGFVTRTSPVNLVGSVENVFGSVPIFPAPGSVHQINVVVDEMSWQSGTITNWGFNLHTGSPAVASIATINGNFLETGGAPASASSCVVPDSSGDWRCDWTTLGAGSHTGEGILADIGIECDAVGSSTLWLDDDPPVGNGVPDINGAKAGDPTVALPVLDWTGKPGGLPVATIYCGMPAPSLSDLTIPAGSVVVGAPGTFTAGNPFPVTVDALVQNLGPTGPTNADVTETLVNTEGDCTIISPAMPVNSVPMQSLAVGAPIPVPTQTFTVTCAHTSLHHFTATATVSIDPADAGHVDGNGANNSSTSAPVTTAITAVTDVAIVGASTTSSAPLACLPGPLSGNTCPPSTAFPVVTMGQPQTVTVHKNLQIVGGYNLGVPVTDTVTFGIAGVGTPGATESPCLPATNCVSPCILTTAVSCTWQPYTSPSGLPVTTCTVTSPATGTASTSVVLSGAAVTPVTFTFTVVCDVNSFFDSHHPEAVVLLFHDDLSIDHSATGDPLNHISETATTNNHSGPFGSPFWSRAPFNPAATFTIDSNDAANATSDPLTIPAAHNCLTNGSITPAPPPFAPMTGLPCEMYTTTDVPAGNALGLAAVLMAQHAFGQPGFEVAPGITVANGTAVAYFGFNVNLDFGTGCVVTIGAAYPTVRLVDGALPVGGGTDPTPAVSEGPDSGLAADLANPNVWPTRLNSDPLVQSLAAATLWARYTGTAPGIGTAVNILVYNAGTYFVTIAVTGDPTVPTPVGSQCTPLHAEVDYLGKESATLAIQSISAAGVVTTQSTLPAGFAPGDSVTIASSGAVPCNTTWTVLAVTGPNTFTIGCLGNTGAALGTVTDTTLAGHTQILRQCDDVSNGFTPGANGLPGLATKYWFPAVFTRGDDYEQQTVIDMTNSCTASDTSVTLAKNDTLGAPVPPAANEIDGGITYTQNVTYTIAGSGSTLTLTLTGPAVCNPHWTNPLDSFPSNIGGVQTSVVTIPNAATGTAQYSFNCPPGYYSGTDITNPDHMGFQIIANLTSGPGEVNTTNNQFENHITLNVLTDRDHDGVPNNLDACPDLADPEGAGPDPSDTVSTNGCPDTNVSVGPVVKDENYSVDVSVDTTKHVDITVTNSEYPANVLVHILAVSQIGQCEVRLVAQPGDSYSAFFSDEWSNSPINTIPGHDGIMDTLNSQVEKTIPMTAGQQIVLHYDYIIHCFQKSSHSPAFELQVDAIPTGGVVEENLGLDQTGSNCGANGHGPNDNVYKNCPNVTAWEKANLAKTCDQMTTTAVPPQGTGNFTITETCHVTNLGPYGLPSGTVTFSDNVIFSMPPDCQIVGTPVLATGGTLNGSAPATETSTWTVHCANPSNHTFTANDTITLTGPIHVYDPCPNPTGDPLNPLPVPGEPTCEDNNSGSSSVVVEIWTTSDPSVSNVQILCGPNPANVNDTITCVETETVALGAATSGSLTSTLSAPPDCTITSPNPVTQAAVNGTNTTTYTVKCSGPSDHTFSKTVCLTAPLPLHVTDSNPNNNCGTATALVVVIQPVAITVTVTSPAHIDIAGDHTTVSPLVVITSVPPVVAITWTENWGNSSPTTSCIGIPGVPVVHTGATTPFSGTTTPVTLTVPAGAHECGFTVCVTAVTSAVHVVGTGTNCATSVIESNVLTIKYCLDVGPAAVNLSDTNGRYLWVICEVGNLSSDTELVHVSMDVTPLMPPPTGCTRTTSQVLPGSAQFLMSAHEQKVLVWRVRYECHAPATAQVIDQTVTVGITHCDTTTSLPGPITSPTPGGVCAINGETGTVANGDVETNLNDNTNITTKPVIIQ